MQRILISRPFDGAFEIAVKEAGGLLFGAGEEVAVTVERDGYRGAAEEGREGLRVDAGGDYSEAKV